MPAQIESQSLREFIYLDTPRVLSLAAQLGVERGSAGESPDRVGFEQLFASLEPALHARQPLDIGPAFDFANWTPEAFTDGRLLRATGAIRLLDFSWLSLALGGLPAVLKRMSKMEMEALKSSDEGRRMSKSQLQQRSMENQSAIAKVEEFKADELGASISRLYGEVVRVKLRPSPAEQPRAVLAGSAAVEHFYDSPAALSQKYGIEVDAGWTVLGQVNAPNPAAGSQPIPTGNKMEDAFEQIALLMNNAFRMASAPAFPAVSFTPIAMYRSLT